MKFGENLKLIRKSKKISQEELADKLGVSRQSVSKWETGENYPSMTNIMCLCDIFKCKINELVHEDFVDINFLDEEIKMSVVKFKKEKQNQMKGISKVLSLIGKIAGIVVRVAFVFVLILIITVPILFNNIDVKNGKLISINKNITIVQNDDSIDIKMGKIGLVADINNRDVVKLSDTIKVYSKPIVTGLIEIGFIVLAVFLVILWKLLKHLELLFDNINKGETPFTLDNVRHIKQMSYLMIACIILSGIGETIFNFSVERDFTFGLEIFDIVEILFLYSMSLISEYGYEIQLDSKGRIYGELNE